MKGARLKAPHHAQCHMLKHWKMAANVCTVLKTSASTESYRQGMNTQVVKGTAHTGRKEIIAKITMMTLAGFDIEHFKKTS